jgi:hypothetical protein
MPSIIVVPPNFLQLYCVNVLVEHSSVPAVYLIMANRVRETYSRAFRFLRDYHLHGNLPTLFLSDFEQGNETVHLNIFINIL